MTKTYSPIIRCVKKLYLLLIVSLVLASSASADLELDRGLKEIRNQAWFGDYKAMVERRVIRALVLYSKTFFFLTVQHLKEQPTKCSSCLSGS